MIAAALRLMYFTAAAVAVTTWQICLGVLRLVLETASTLRQGVVIIYRGAADTAPVHMTIAGRGAVEMIAPGVGLLARSFGRAFAKLVSMIGAGTVGLLLADSYQARGCGALEKCGTGLSWVGFGVFALAALIGLVFSYAEVLLGDMSLRLGQPPTPNEHAVSGDAAAAPTACSACSGVLDERLGALSSQLASIQAELHRPWWEKVVRRAR